MSDNLRARWINRYQFIFLMHRNKDLSRGGIVNGVARPSTKRDRSDELVGDGVDDGIRVAVLVGDENSLYRGRVSNPIRIVDWASGGDGLQRGRIDNVYLVLASRGGVDAIEFGDGPDTVHVREAVKRGCYFVLLRVEHDELVGVHVRNIKAVLRGIEILVIEADGGAGKRNVGDEL